MKHVPLEISYKILNTLHILMSRQWRSEGGQGGAAAPRRQNPTKIIASLISVIKIVQYFRIVGGGGHWWALKSYKMKMIISIVGKNIMLINNIIVYCLSPTDACEL